MLKRILGLVALLFIGAAVAAVGALSHRTYPYVGVAAVIAMTLTAALFARLWHDWAGLSAFAGAWAVVVFVLAQEGPGGSVLIVDDALGKMYLLGSAIAIVIVAMVPGFLLKGREDVA